MNWIDALGSAIEEAEPYVGQDGYPEFIEALIEIRDFLIDNPDKWEGERNKATGPRWKVGDRFANPPHTPLDYKFTVVDVAFAPHYGEWIYTCEFDHGTIDDFGEEDLQQNIQIHD